MNRVYGRSASPGITIGTAFIYEARELTIPRDRDCDPREEHRRIRTAFNAAREELEVLKEKISSTLGDEAAHIFRAQMTMTEDEDLLESLLDTVSTRSVCAEEALEAVFEEYLELFGSMEDDDYNKQRMTDLQDVYGRLLRLLLGVEQVSLTDLPAGSIVIAEDLMPSDTAAMDTEHIKGIIVQKGGITSHVAILAKNLGLPASVGTRMDLSDVRTGQTLALDTSGSDTSVICIDPDEQTLNHYRREIGLFEQKRERLQSMRGLDAVTTDGRTIQLSANVGSAADLEGVQEQRAGSIGLLRTEFFFLQSSQLPTEDQQFEFYREAALTAPELVVIRTLDIGGDKHIPSFSLPKEENPFLGLRGVRVSLRFPQIFKTQLRAILRAAMYGKISIMVPFIADVTELRAVRALLDTCAQELAQEQVPCSRDVELGLMAETPASVLLADVLAAEGAFVSIGTNDLTQYLLTADRTNAEISSYYRIFSPAVFRAVNMICQQVHAKGKWVGVCGELGGNLKAIPVLIGLGVDELSMSARTLSEATELIRSLSYQQCVEAAQQVLQCGTEEEVIQCLTGIPGRT
ncbi:MAG: phosphoenolpyruvate--protein phosphotransferase [Spirochaetia bacterium]|nr:phosphoenolpyruvate--protein phosphotransferase [Spirochaetia bacterium]